MRRWASPALTFGLIRQPEVDGGFGDPTVFVPLVGGLVLLAAFLVYEARASHPMLPLDLFRSHNFSVGNLETLSMYAGLSLLFFFLVLFLQNVAGYSAVAAGLGRPADHGARCSCCRRASGRSRIATARVCSWASGRWWRRRAWR